MDFNFEFDYMNGTLNEWLDKVEENMNEGTEHPFINEDNSIKVKAIESEYLPRFEQAIYQNLSSKMIGYGNAARTFEPVSE